MEITLKRVVDEKGNRTFTINGKNPGFLVSRQLTGSDAEEDGGIFSSLHKVKICYGKYQKTFQFLELNDAMSLYHYRVNLAQNIYLVRVWIEDCKAEATTEELTFNI